MQGRSNSHTQLMMSIVLGSQVWSRVSTATCFNCKLELDNVSSSGAPGYKLPRYNNRAQFTDIRHQMGGSEVAYHRQKGSITAQGPESFTDGNSIQWDEKVGSTRLAGLPGLRWYSAAT
uniref:Uncharacterized protein n=1 Tax=Eutreptiella gymnastica TaxID=73025 RepID=A0A7S4FS76_9EUGL